MQVALRRASPPDGGQQHAHSHARGWHRHACLHVAPRQARPPACGQQHTCTCVQGGVAPACMHAGGPEAGLPACVSACPCAAACVHACRWLAAARVRADGHKAGMPARPWAARMHACGGAGSSMHACRWPQGGSPARRWAAACIHACRGVAPYHCSGIRTATRCVAATSAALTAGLGVYVSGASRSHTLTGPGTAVWADTRHALAPKRSTRRWAPASLARMHSRMLSSCSHTADVTPSGPHTSCPDASCGNGVATPRLSTRSAASLSISSRWG